MGVPRDESKRTGLAIGLGLLAVRGASGDRLLSGFPELWKADLRPICSGRWQWLDVDLSKYPTLAAAEGGRPLRQLQKAALHVWTEKGRWHLRLYRPGAEPFGYVQDLEQLREGRRSRSKLTTTRAIALSDALREAKVPHDPAGMVATLLGASLSKVERRWTVGNLPRFLDGLGLGQVFLDWQDWSPEAAGEPLPAALKEAPDLCRAILDRLAGTQARLIRGGPVQASPADAWGIARSCGQHVMAGFVIKPPPPRGIQWPPGVSFVRGGGEQRLALEEPFRESFHDIEKILANVDDGTMLEMVTAAVPTRAWQHRELEEGPSAKPAMQRYLGVIKRGRWQLTHTYPAVRADQLERALRLFAQIEAETPFEAADREEATAVVAMAQRSSMFGADGSALPVARGRHVVVPVAPGPRPFRFMYRSSVATLFFRHRFAGGPWDPRLAQEWDEKDRAGTLMHLGGRASPRGARKAGRKP